MSLTFFIDAGACLLLAAYFNLLFLLLLPVVILMMRQIAKQDELIVRILSLRWQFKFKARHREELPDMRVFSPNAYRDKPPVM